MRDTRSLINPSPLDISAVCHCCPQMILLEEEQSSDSTPILNYDNEEPLFISVSFRRVPRALLFELA